MAHHDPLASSEEIVDPYHELFERSADAILILEGDTFVDCNQAAMDMLGYSTKEELLQLHPSAVSPPRQPDGRNSREKADEIIALAFREGNRRFEWIHKRADGVLIPVEVLLTAVQRGERRILHAVLRDLTEQKALEEQLRHAQKMEAIGKLSGGIAHDFNNLLVAILCNCELLSEHLKDKPEQLELADEIMAAGERAASLVQRLLTFGRKQQVQPKIIDMGEVCTHLQSLLVRLIGEDVQLETTVPAHPAWVKIDPGQLEQVVINLVTNARDALPRGGAITVQVRRIELEGATLPGSFGELPPGSYALLSVTDNGSGMTGDIANRAFEPFFTTKKVGQGTGLGLATVYGIAKQAGGAATIYSSVSEGTSVKVALPIAKESGQAVAWQQDLSTQGGHETILVVEDDPAVSSLVSRVLSDKGYELLQASNGMEALEVWEQAQGNIDLILTDVVMPISGGADLVHELRQRGVSPRVLFASGYTNNALATLRALGDEVDLLEKPFSTAELLGRIRLALDRPVS